MVCCVFVHDFVTIPMPMASALAVVENMLRNQSEELIRQAWLADMPIWTAAGLTATDLDPTAQFEVNVGLPTLRPDAAVMHFGWTVTGARLIPSLDADLELAARGTELSDLQILGRYRFGSDPPSTSNETNLVHRAVVTAVRRLLTSIAEQSAKAPGLDTHESTGQGMSR